MSKQSDLVNITQGDADINGGTIDGTVIGGSTPAAISGTTGTFSENLTISGSARRITGDMSDSTHANRLAFQSSTVNGSTSPFFLPNGTATIASAVFSNASDPTNSSFFQIGIDGSNRAFINSGSLGTGTALPLAIITDLSERMRITSTGSVGIGTSSPSAKLEVSGADDTNLLVVGHGDTDFAVYTDGTVGEVRLKAEDGSGGNFSKFMTFYTQPSGTAADERMRIDASGNVGIGTSSPSETLTVNGHSITSGDYHHWFEQVKHWERVPGAISYDANESTAMVNTGSYRVPPGNSGMIPIATIKTRGFQNYICVKTNWTQDNLMFQLRYQGYMYGNGIADAHAGGYTYTNNSVISKTQYENGSGGQTISDTYRTSEGHLCFKIYLGHIGYSEGVGTLWFGGHGDDWRDIQVLAVQIRNDGTNHPF